jgi:ribosomal protein L7/L12
MKTSCFPGQGTGADVERLVAAGRKIDAIKVYRRVHQSDPKTAKDAVDRLAARPDLRGGVTRAS